MSTLSRHLWGAKLRTGTLSCGNRAPRGVYPIIEDNFRVTREIRIPRVGGAKLRMYTGYRLEPR